MVRLSTGFQIQLKWSHVSSYTDELLYNETVCLGIIYIYIYNRMEINL